MKNSVLNRKKSFLLLLNLTKYALHVFALNLQLEAKCEKSVIFDLGGVLFEQKLSAPFILRHIGLTNLVTYSIVERFNIKDLRKAALTLLDKIKPRDHTSPVHIPFDDKGQPLPLLMQEWLEGTRSGQEILTFVEGELMRLPTLCSSAIQKIIFLKIVQLIFDPLLFIQTQTLHSDAWQIIKKLKESGFKVYILSNWDRTSFNLLRKRYTYFFNLFDGITISGNHGDSKPSNTFYTTFLKTHELNAAECIFIDDQQINVDSASLVGMNAFICPYKKLFLKNKKANLKMACKIIEKKAEHSAKR
jgi:HAD superfamily hydrolase (TIGR01509 family)